MNVLSIRSSVKTLFRKAVSLATALATTSVILATVPAIQHTQAAVPQPFRTFHATLLQLNEVGGVPFTGAYGTAQMSFDPSTMQLTYVISATGIPTATGLHIHKGPIGVNGPVAIDLKGTQAVTGGVPFVGAAILTPAQMADLYAGLYYVNLHTVAHPGGEMRGQLLTSEVARVFSAHLTGSNETPANSSVGLGMAAVVLKDTFDSAAYFLQVSNVVSLTASHIHTGTVLVTGSVAIGLSGAFSADEMISGTFALNQFQLLTLFNNGYYVNVHSAAFPAGELRGQLRANNTAYAARLSGLQETPPVTTTAVGQALFTIDNSAGAVNYELIVSGVPSATAAHIHTGTVGITGPVAHNLGSNISPNTLLSGTLQFNDLHIATMETGGYYANVHTLAHPSGEIRGQIGPVQRFLAFKADLNGANEVPTVTTSATGSATFVLDSLTYQLAYRWSSSNMTPTAVHIHSGAVGITGSVVVPLDLSGSGVVTLSALQAAPMLVNGYYINVHSAAFPGGEIRGQINPAAIPIRYIAALSGLQENPPVTTSVGGGLAVYLLDPTQTQLNYQVSVTNIVSITAAHIHRGAAGANGPVAYNLLPPSTPFDVNTPISGTVGISAEDLVNLLTGRLYTNIHTTSNPGGEIRGQLFSPVVALYLPVLYK